MFSKWKNMVRRSNPENEQQLINSIITGANLIEDNDCLGYVRNIHRYLPRCIRNEPILD